MNDWLEYLKYTITTYNISTKKELLNIYRENHIAVKKDKQINLFSNEQVEIDENNIDNTLYKCFELGIKSIEFFEKFNIEKAYKYSVLFKTNNINEKLGPLYNIPEIQKKFNIYKLTTELQNPIRLMNDDKVMLLFNKKYEAYHPENGNTLLLKYPIVVVFYIESGIVEFRFDSIKRIFTGIDRDQNVYSKLVKELIEYIKHNYDIDLKIIPLEKIIAIASDNKNDGIRLCTQHMNFKNGGRAQLRTGDDGKYIMPFVGELKSMMLELEDEFSKNDIIKERLESFIKEKEITSEYPLVEVDFLDKNKIKHKNNHVKFTFNYMNNGFCLISYYYNSSLLGMERMNDVTNFIEKNIMQ